MTDIPEAAVSDDLVEAVLNAEEGIENAPEWFRSDKRADIRAILTAAAPIIRADERRRVIAEIQATNLGAPLQLNPDGTARFLTGPELRERICALIAERNGK